MDESHRHRPMFAKWNPPSTPEQMGESEVDLVCTTCGLTEHLVMPARPVSAREAAWALAWTLEEEGSEVRQMWRRQQRKLRRALRKTLGG